MSRRFSYTTKETGRLSSSSPFNSDLVYGYQDEAGDELEAIEYPSSNESGHSSPFLDQPPSLPSPSAGSESSGDIKSPPDTQNSQHDATSEATGTQTANLLSRHTLAQRLARIARQLATTSEHELPVDPLVLTEQVNQLEMTILGIPTPPGAVAVAALRSESPTIALPVRPGRLATIRRSRHLSPESVSETAAQLSQDLETLHSNLRARHEEATHIQAILLTRLELAAQRILQLQSHADELERQLRASDDEMGHLRVLLKALEIQVPEHPDEDLRRCLARVREEFWEVRKSREARRQRK